MILSFLFYTVVKFLLFVVSWTLLDQRYIRCAYEYGVPQASHRYCGTGPYNGGEVWDAERHLE